MPHAGCRESRGGGARNRWRFRVDRPASTASASDARARHDRHPPGDRRRNRASNPADGQPLPRRGEIALGRTCRRESSARRTLPPSCRRGKRHSPLLSLGHFPSAAVRGGLACGQHLPAHIVVSADHAEAPVAPTVELKLRAIDPQTVEAGKPLAVAVSVREPQQWEGNLRFRLEPGGPSGASIDPQSGKFSWTPPLDQAAGKYDVTVSAQGPERPDGAGDFCSHRDAANFTAMAPLKFKAVGPQRAEIGRPLTLPLTLEYAAAWEGKVQFTLAPVHPPGATIDAERGVFTWTPAADQATGKYDVTVSVRGPNGRSDQTSFAVKVTPSLYASASAETSTTPLTDLPLLEEADATWSPDDDARSASIGAARRKVLQGLEEKSWNSLLAAIVPFHMRPYRLPPVGPDWRTSAGSPGADYRPRPMGPDNTQQSIDIPERFILTGRLAALRISEGKSLVFVQPDQNTPLHNAYPNASSFGGRFPMMGNGGVATCAAVEFEGETLGWTMSDYRVGDSIRIAVQRLTNNKLEPLQPGQQPRRVPGPYGNMLLVLPGIMDELRLLQCSGALVAQPAFRMSCWCFRGQGLEKAGQTGTWIDARLGRAGTMAADMIRRSPGFLMRTAQISKGTSGRLIATIDGIARLPQDCVAYLTVPQTMEGPIHCVACFGPTVQAAEFLDYRPGAVVEVAATVQRPTLGYPRHGKVDVRGHATLPGWNRSTPARLADRLDIPPPEVQRDLHPGATCHTGGCSRSRRTNLSISPATPEAAVAALDKVQGEEATWSGSCSGSVAGREKPT